MTGTITLPYLGQISLNVGLSSAQYRTPSQFPGTPLTNQVVFFNPSNYFGAFGSCTGGQFGLHFYAASVNYGNNQSPLNIGQIYSGTISAYGVNNYVVKGAVSSNPGYGPCIMECGDDTAYVDCGASPENTGSVWNVSRIYYPSDLTEDITFPTMPILETISASNPNGAGLETDFPVPFGTPSSYQPLFRSFGQYAQIGSDSPAFSTANGSTLANLRSIEAVIYSGGSMQNHLGYGILYSIYGVSGMPGNGTFVDLTAAQPAAGMGKVGQALVKLNFELAADTAAFQPGTLTAPWGSDGLILIPGGHFMFHIGSSWYIVMNDISGYYRASFTGITSAAASAISNSQCFGQDNQGNFWFQSGYVLYTTMGFNVGLPTLSGLALANITQASLVNCVRACCAHEWEG